MKAIGDVVTVHPKWTTPAVGRRSGRLWEPDVSGSKGLAILIASTSWAGTALEYVLFRDTTAWVPIVSRHGAYHDPATGRTEWAVSEPSCRPV